MLLLLVLGSFHLPLTSVRAHGVRLVGTVLCFKESAAETDGWHVSSTATKGRGWVQPRATFPPALLPAAREAPQQGDRGSQSCAVTELAGDANPMMLFWKFSAGACFNLNLCRAPGQT